MGKAKPRGVGVPVSERALIQRIQRRLAEDDRMLRRTRKGTRAEFDLGEFFVVDTTIGGAVETKIDLEDYGRELGALADYEVLALGE